MQYFAKMYSDIPVMDLARNRLADYPLKDQISALLLFYRSEEMFNNAKWGNGLKLIVVRKF